MKVILIQDVKSLGKKGDIVEINDGYARNYVIPKKFGLEATNKNLNDLKLQKANEVKIAKEKLEQAKEFADQLKDKSYSADENRGGRQVVWLYLHKRDCKGGNRTVRISDR